MEKTSKQPDVFCIVGTGRSGSSLMANILAHSGANFILPPSREWDAVRGDMEHSLCHKAYSYLTKVNKIDSSLLPNFIFKRYFTKKFNRSINELGNIPYLKSSTLVYLVPFLAKANPDIKVIVMYRDFGSYAKSRHKKFGWDYARLRSEYINAYKTSLLQLETYGGLAINFNDVLNSSKDEWIQALAQLTGIDMGRLIAARDDLCKLELVSNTSMLNSDSDIQFLYTELESTKNTLY